MQNKAHQWPVKLLGVTVLFMTESVPFFSAVLLLCIVTVVQVLGMCLEFLYSSPILFVSVSPVSPRVWMQ